MSNSSSEYTACDTIVKVHIGVNDPTRTRGGLRFAASPSLSSLSIHWRRQPAAGATLERSRYRRTNVNASGFPRGYLTREKRIGGFSTGDLVRARVPEHLKTGGVHVGRVAVRASGSFRVGKLDGISAKYCQVVQRADGYSYALRNDAQGGGASSPRVNAGASAPR